MSTIPEIRTLPVPDGLEGERVDAAISRMFGFSRTKAAELAAAGKVQVDGAVVGKSERVRGGAWLEVEMPQAPAPVQVVAEPVEGMEIVHDDDDVVVIVKPVGVAAHPSPGWSGPTVIGGLAAAGYRISTSGAAERQGIVHRLDVGTSGLMVVAKSEYAYTSLKRQFKERTVDKRYHTLVQGHPDPTSGTIDAPIGRHPNHDYKWAVTADGKPSVTHYDLIEAFRAASLLDVKLETGRTHQIRVHWPPTATRASATSPTAPTPPRQAAAPDPPVAARRTARFRAPRGRQLGGVRERLPRGPAEGPRPGPGGDMGVSAPCTVRVAEDPADRAACFAVRKEVFVVEQGVAEDIEYDAYDAVAVHVLAVREDGLPLGTGRLLHGEAAVAKTGGDPSVGSPGAARRPPRGARARRRRGPGARPGGRGPRAGPHGGGPARTQTHALGFYERLGYAAYGPNTPGRGHTPPGDAPSPVAARLGKPGAADATRTG